MRVCKNCGTDISHRLGNCLYCSAKCGALFRNKAHYHAHALEFRDKRARYRTDRLEAGILARIKGRAKANKIPFNIDITDIVVPEVCPILGIPIITAYGKGSGFHHNSPSVDRINPKLGYTKGNVRVISCRANLLKNDATVAELEAVLKDLKSR